MQVTSIKSEDRKKKRIGIDHDKSRHFGSSNRLTSDKLLELMKKLWSHVTESGNNLEI